LKQVSDNKIFWLASYPKSGNTWFRLFLTSLLNESDSSFDFNQLGYGQEPGKRKHFDELNGFSSTSLSLAEINQIRPATLSWFNHSVNEKQFFKTHSAYVYNEDRSPVLGSTQTGIAGAVYFVRNPLDVCISYAHHCNESIDDSIERMANKRMKSHKANKTCFIPEELGSWSENVSSWVNTQNIPVMVLRYEDMLANTFDTFSKACDFLKLEKDLTSIQNSINDCDFKKLQKLEQNTVFTEKPSVSESFFRKGVAGDWVNTLSSTQVERIVND